MRIRAKEMMMRSRATAVPFLALALTLTSLPPGPLAGQSKSEGKLLRMRPNRPAGAHGPGSSSKPDKMDAEVAVAWFDLLYDTIRTERISPPVASRVIAYAGVALYEAVVPTAGGESLAGQLNALPPLPQTDAKKKYHLATVANVALADTLRGLFPMATQPSRDAIDALEAELAATMPPPTPTPVLSRSEELGHEIAQAILAWAATDGYATYNACPYTPPTGAGMWVPTAPGTTALQPCWGQLRPFVLTSGEECGAPPPPAYSTDPGSDFYAEAYEVYQTRINLTDEQMAIARFWADGTGTTGTPPGHWISIVGQVVTERHLSLETAARAYAAAGIAMADAFISTWETKFTYNLLRPVTYIQAGIDPSWTPFIPTPPFPEYTSGHSVQSAAAAAVLTDVLGTVSFTDDTHAAAGLPPRSFDSFVEAAQEAAISRLYGGIHFRSAIENGMDQGKCVAQRILDRVELGQ
jgi:hypothetical protein